MLPAISKQRKLQPSSHRSCPQWQAPRALRMEPSRLPPGWQPSPTVHPEGIRVGKKRILAPDSWGQIKGMISVSPDSCIFPYTVQLSSAHSVVSDSATPWTAAHQASLSITNSQSLPKLMSIVSVMPSSHLILCRPLLLLPSIFPSIRAFSNESALRIRWPKYWSFSFNISPSKEHPGLISFRRDWLDFLAVQGTLKSLLQHYNSKESINSSVLSFLYSPTLTSIHDHWKNHSLD